MELNSTKTEFIITIISLVSFKGLISLSLLNGEFGEIHSPAINARTCNFSFT